MNRSTLSLAMVAAALVIPSPSAAREGPAPPSEPLHDELQPGKRWYGWQILIPTLVGDALTATGYFFFPPLMAGASARALGGPIVHLAHRKPLRALASFGLEGALPTSVFVGGYFLSGGCEGAGGGCGVAIAFMILAPVLGIAGTVVDMTVLAYDDAPRKAQGADTSLRLTLVPLVLPREERTANGVVQSSAKGLGLVGRF